MKKTIYLLMCPLLISCGNVVKQPSASYSSSRVDYDSVCAVDSVVEDVYVDDYYDDGAASSVETESTFRPVSATISDSEGTFTSSEFDCPDMVVYDNGSSVELSWGGEHIPLYGGDSPGTYIASQSKAGTMMKFVAYRSSNTGKIYLVINTTTGNGQSVEIKFKP